MKILSTRKGKLLFYLSTSAFAILAAVVLIHSNKKPQPDIAVDDNPMPSETQPEKEQITDFTIADILSQNLPHNIPLTDISAHISQDGYIQVDCILLSDSLAEFFQSFDTTVPAPVKLIATMLPERVPVSFAMQISLDSQSGKLSLSPQKLSLNGMDISPALLPREFEMQINRTINDFLFKHDEKIRALDLSDGKITITLTKK